MPRAALRRLGALCTDLALKPYLLFALVAYAFCLVAFCLPEIKLNETVYLLASRRLFSPGLFAHDPFLGGPVWNSLSLLFSAIISPLWLLTDDPVTVAMAGRAIVWLPTVVALFLFLRSMRIAPIVALVGFGTWALWSQSSAAQEWIIDGVEQKVCAYGCVFAALVFLKENRIGRAALFLGLATAFHVAVGGWAAISAFVALLVERKSVTFAGLLRFSAIGAAVALPFVAAGFPWLHAPAAAAPADGNLSEALVTLRNPHHTDPAYFLTPLAAARTAATFGLVLFVLSRRRSEPAGARMLWFFSSLAALWILGLAARLLHQFWFLNVYPFRVGDTLFPLLLLTLVPDHLRRAAQLGARARRWARPALGAALALALVLCLWRDQSLLYPGYMFSKAWSRDSDPRRALHAWVRSDSSPDDTFLVEPCAEADFPLFTSRPVFVLVKLAPVSGQFWEWKRRVELLSGGALADDRGLPVCERIAARFDRLPRATLQRLAREHGVAYYVTSAERDDLARPPAFSDGALSVYRIE
jgi:hypothetical protein